MHACARFSSTLTSKNGRPNIEFASCSDRPKRRTTAEIRASATVEELSCATQISLHNLHCGLRVNWQTTELLFQMYFSQMNVYLLPTGKYVIKMHECGRQKIHIGKDKN
ncbi:uncharacterized protein LOC105663523 [Megachile rotundata]|uniref:uncharacterized protein LOC105663523 n=1 Tax=Megachile rotundata TaxID=143995 RepID=UPI0006153B2D|nr:PREDICTED: uncharacterized protein LOC105663523 [Megachile rotundata]